MAGFMEVSFSLSGMSQPSFSSPSHSQAHWGYVTNQTHQVAPSRKRSCDQAFLCQETVKKSKPEDLPVGDQVTQPGHFVAFHPTTGTLMQACSFPSSYMEHQNVLHAESVYQSSMLDALLHEAHGC